MGIIVRPLGFGPIGDAIITSINTRKLQELIQFQMIDMRLSLHVNNVSKKVGIK